MKTIYNLFLGLIILGLPLSACEENNDVFPNAATLKVVHAAPDVPITHVNYLGLDINFSSGLALSFKSNRRFNLPAGEARSIIFTYLEDTTRQVFSQNITLDAGEISTYYIVGDSANLSGFLTTEVFQNYQDSVFGVSFVHASDDSEILAIRAIQLDNEGVSDTTLVTNSLAFQETTDFLPFESTTRIDAYTFQYLDASGSILASFSIDPLRRRREKVFRNITLPLVGRTDDGEGGSSLEVIQIDNF